METCLEIGFDEAAIIYSVLVHGKSCCLLSCLVLMSFQMNPSAVAFSFLFFFLGLNIATYL